MKRPRAVWLLTFLLAFLAFGGFYGGVLMLVDPTGAALQMADVLPLLPVPDYLWPGLFLIAVMGLLPLFLVSGLIWRPEWGWTTALTGWSRRHWAWTGSLALGVTLLVWLTVQALLIGFQWPIQYLTLANGLLIIAVAMLPALSRYYARR